MTPARPVTGTPEGDADTTTVHFNYRGVAYTIDLDPTGIVEFETALAPYTSAARQWVASDAAPETDRRSD